MIIGRLTTVKNGKKKGRGPLNYNALTYLTRKGEVKTAFLTDKELCDAENRASKNPEDLPKMGFWDKVHMFFYTK